MNIEQIIANAQAIRAQQGQMVRFRRDDGVVCEFSYASLVLPSTMTSTIRAS